MASSLKVGNYPFKSTENKWQEIWQQNKTYETSNQSDKKCYVLEMLPYPSGRLHMGHVRNYAIGDAIARFLKANGLNVLHPMGWDAFGLPAENAAIQNNSHPGDWTVGNIAEMKKQLNALGFSYDWEREVTTCHHDYYGHEQKIFLDFYKKGLVERKESWVNWDPVDNTVLANEQVIDGKGWRTGALVEKRKLNQWSIKITQYAESLLNDLDTLTGWPEKVTKMQENWIGKSQGASFVFKIVPNDVLKHDSSCGGECAEIPVFTTRPETLYGASFCAISPNHPLVEALLSSGANSGLAAFVAQCQQMATSEEAISTAEKLGFNTGLFVAHPFDDSVKLPVYIANFVLMEYGTGAIFGCPAHDERDFEFATKYGLKITKVVEPLDANSKDDAPLPYTGPGVMVNSGFMDGLSVEDARKASIKKLEDAGQGQGKTLYRLRDWSVSRQRYWGCPIPFIHCDDCGAVPVPESDLPVKLPTDVSFDKPGNPLDHHPTWKHVSCPSCGKKAVRETDTLDTFFESSWYFLRYISPKESTPFNREDCNNWMPVDWYIGGIEHAVLHLLYARFFTKALRDCGYLNVDEPFKNLITQGMVCHATYKDEKGNWLYPEDVVLNDANETVHKQTGEKVKVGGAEKMSKSKKNLVDPQTIMDSHGADVARLFILSDTPIDRDFDWNTDALDGAWRYLNKVWRVAHEAFDLLKTMGQEPAYYFGCEAPSEAGNSGTKDVPLIKKAHQFLEKIADAYKVHAFNKVIAFHRELAREIERELESNGEALANDLTADNLRQVMEIFLHTLAPIAPHITHDLWDNLHGMAVGDDDAAVSILYNQPWPQVNRAFTKVDEITIVVQINGKLRCNFKVSPEAGKDVLENLALDAAKPHLNGAPHKKIIVVPGRLVNIVV